MAKYDHGVYEPNEELRVFDGAEDEDDVEGSRLPLLIVLALLVLAMFGGVVWLAYTQGVARGRGETPVLTAAAGPERVAPPQAGGSNVPYQGFKIYEQPAPPDDNADSGAQSVPPESVPLVRAPQSQPVGGGAPSKPAPQAMAPAAEPKAPPVEPKPVPPPAKPAAAPSKPAPAAAQKPSSVAALIQQADTGPAKAAAAGPATAGAYVLQIGAYKSQADADGAWQAYKARHAALLSGYASDVKQVDLGAKGTWYRLRVAGFSDREVASALCERLKADGGACILAK